MDGAQTCSLHPTVAALPKRQRVGGCGGRREAPGWPDVERPLVQILVVVAITQVRILRSEVGKGSILTVVGYGLAGPKSQVNSVYVFIEASLDQLERESC